MIKKIVLASNNKNKIKEIEEFFNSSGKNYKLLKFSDVFDEEMPVEDGKTFKENALIKAKFLAAKTDLPVLADDSGLSVELLNNMPGILSARWSGVDANDEKNRKLILQQLNDFKQIEDRKAFFVCTLAFIDKNKNVFTFEGKWEGYLSKTKNIETGFGYNPIFIPNEFPELTAEDIDIKTRNKISHRAKALEQLIKIL